MKTCAIIQARQTSSRLYGKSLIDISGKPNLQRMIERVRQANIDDVIVACTINHADDAIVELCESIECNYYRGSEEDVMSRVLEAAKEFNVDIIVELTADCPLIDWNHINSILNDKIEDGGIYGNIVGDVRTYPRGYDIRVFTRNTLIKAEELCDNPIDKQHVSTLMYLNPKFKDKFFWVDNMATIKEFRPDIEVTLDTPEDLELIRWLFEAGKEYKLELTCAEVINLIDTYPEKYTKVAKVKRKDYFEELNDFYSSQKRGNKKK